MKLLPDEILNESKAIAHEPPVVLPFGPGKIGGPRLSVGLAEDGPELRVELARGALGEVGHDRLRFSSAVEPSLCLSVDILADRSRRHSGQPLAESIHVEAAGLAIVTIVEGPQSLRITAWLAPSFRRWMRSRHLDLSAGWALLVSRIVWVVGDDNKIHPSWAALAALDWSRLEAATRGR